MRLGSGAKNLNPSNISEDDGDASKAKTCLDDCKVG
jgi:hypothetical protein